MDQKLIIFILLIIGIFYFSQMNNKLNSSYNGSSITSTNSSNMGLTVAECSILESDNLQNTFQFYDPVS